MTPLKKHDFTTKITTLFSAHPFGHSSVHPKGCALKSA